MFGLYPLQKQLCEERVGGGGGGGGALMLKLFDSETYGDNETLGIQILQNKKYSEEKWGNLTPKGVRVG